MYMTKSHISYLNKRLLKEFSNMSADRKLTDCHEIQTEIIINNVFTTLLKSKADVFFEAGGVGKILQTF